MNEPVEKPQKIKVPKKNVTLTNLTAGIIENLRFLP
jgi:hypothetical protein